jgi:serine/threonine protein phosphatase PrpC
MWRKPEASAVVSLSLHRRFSSRHLFCCVFLSLLLSLLCSTVLASSSAHTAPTPADTNASSSSSFGAFSTVRLVLDLAFVGYLVHSLYHHLTQAKQPLASSPWAAMSSSSCSSSKAPRRPSPTSASGSASASASQTPVVERIDSKIHDIQSQLFELHALVADVDQPSDSLRDLLDSFVDGLEEPVLQINAFASVVSGPPHNSAAEEQARNADALADADAARQQQQQAVEAAATRQSLQAHTSAEQHSTSSTPSCASPAGVAASSAEDLLASLTAGMQSDAGASSAADGLLASLTAGMQGDAGASSAAGDLLASLTAGMQGEGDAGASSAAGDLLASLTAGMQSDAGVSSAAGDLLASLTAGTTTPLGQESSDDSGESGEGGLNAAEQLLASLNANAASLEEYVVETNARPPDADSSTASEHTSDVDDEPKEAEVPSAPKKSQAEQEAEWLAMAKAKKQKANKQQNYTEVKFGRGGRRNKKKKKSKKRAAQKYSLSDLDAFVGEQPADALVDLSAVGDTAEKNALADLLAFAQPDSSSSVTATAPTSSALIVVESPPNAGSALADLLSSLGEAPATSAAAAKVSFSPVVEVQSTRDASTPNLFGDLFGVPAAEADTAVSAATADRAKREPVQPRHFVAGMPLLRDLAARDDINKSGLRRAKKRPMNWGSKKKKRSLQMEDTNYLAYPFGKDDGVALFGVFDGHVGKYCAQAARERFPAQMQKALAGVDLQKTEDLGEVVREVFSATDKDLLEFEYEGCTATGVVVWRSGEHRYLQCGNVGDSHAFLFRDGQALCLTENHNVKDPAERERMRAQGHQVNEGQTRINGLAVSRALGDHFVKQNDMGMIGEAYVHPVVRLEDTDTLLLVCSDGVWDVISGQEACELVQCEKNADAMAAKLLRYSVRSVGCNDNVTVQVGIL